MQNRATRPPSDRARNIKIIEIAHSMLQFSDCNWCLLPYPTGYVCSCGWDSSYHPDLYEKVEGAYLEYKKRGEK